MYTIIMLAKPGPSLYTPYCVAKLLCPVSYLGVFHGQVTQATAYSCQQHVLSGKSEKPSWLMLSGPIRYVIALLAT